MILTIDTSQIAVPKEDIAGAMSANQRGLLAKVCGVRRDDWQTAGVAGSDLILKSIVETIARTNSATREESLQVRNALREFACLL